LHLLIEDEKEELVDFVLNSAELRADPELIDEKTQMTPLCAAIQGCSLEIVQLLVEAGADVNRCADSMTPL
jgi:ankyrin repeat protein